MSESEVAAGARGAETRGFEPGGRVAGELVLAGSKSLAQRALIAAGLASGTTRITNVPDGDDVRAAAALVESMGCSVCRRAPTTLEVAGLPPGPRGGWSARDGVEAGESGTLARLATAALALCGRADTEHELRVRGSLARRSSAPLFAALERAGVQLSSDGGWPVRLRTPARVAGARPEVRLESPVSSQEVSGLLLALAAWPGESTLHVTGEIPSRPYVSMTLGMLADFGVAVELSAGEPSARGPGTRFVVRGPLRAPATPLELEPDASSAAVALAAACLSGGELRVPRLHGASHQGDVRIVDHLARFGCTAGSEAPGPALVASGAPTRGVELDLSAEPDLAPVLAAVAAAVAHERGDASLLTGLGTLPGKESSRIAVLAEGLVAIGLDAEAGPDRLSVRRAGRPAHGSSGSQAPIVLDPRGDHRMAFAFALLGLIVPGVRVRDPDCVAKSWPGFWDDLATLGARVV